MSREREAHTCVDCGAFLQPVTVAGQDKLRCPWALKVTGREFGGRIYCDRPMGEKRVPGGIRTDSVT